jgi:CubicO group peptidase (beta-lactamase class C family)/predicted N-acetyltransferase YhbS
MPFAPCALLTLLAVQAAGAPPEDEANRLDQWLQRAGFQGGALVAKGDRVLLRRGYGLSDREAGVPYDADTVFSLGSITKQFTAAAILKLEMQGKLRVEDDVARLLPGVPADKQGITIHQLLTHTSGLDSDFADDFDPVGRDAYVARALASKLLSPPGSSYRYSNAGYSLLGAIVEIASGQPYERFLQEQLFRPAGMESTGYRLPKWDPEHVAVGYRNGARWGRLVDKPWAEDGPYWALRANGAIHTTLDDVLRWHRALLGDSVLSAPEKAKMYAKHVAEEAGGDSYYGYGWAVRDEPGAGRVVSHNGGNGVFYAEVIRMLDADTLVVVSTNDSTVRGGRIAEGLARLALGREAAIPEKRGAGASGASLAPLGSAGPGEGDRGPREGNRDGDLPVPLRARGEGRGRRGGDRGVRPAPARMCRAEVAKEPRMPLEDVAIRSERPADEAAIRAVNEEAFGQAAEGRLVDALRGSPFFIRELSLVAEAAGGGIVGHILFTRLKIVSEDEVHPALALAPMSVRPAWQRQGVGSKLVRRGLVVARDLGHSLVVVLGHPSYYPRFGFRPASGFGVRPPFETSDEAFMALVLRPGNRDEFRGVVEYPPQFLDV